MTLRVKRPTPWVEDILRGDPVQAMAIESLARTTEVVGTLQLFGSSARGPWLAIIRIPDGDFNGFRATGLTPLSAVETALAKVTA